MSVVAISDIYDIRTNLKWIRQILHFWFTVKEATNIDSTTNNIINEDNQKNDNPSRNNDIATLQKRLWMISQQNNTLRSNVDHYIIQHFGILLCQLSSSTTTTDSTTTTTTTPPSPTTGATTNTTTTTNYNNHQVLSSSSSSSSSPVSLLLWHQWCIQESDIYGWEGKLAAIIVLDQFSRHVHRGILLSQQQQQQQVPSSSANTDTNNEIVSSAELEYIKEHLPRQSVLDEMAYTTTQLLLQHHSREYYSTSIISIPMRIFAIMPLRHQSTNVLLSSLQQTQQYIDTLFTVQQESCQHMIQAFRKATNRRLAVRQDETRRTGTSGSNSCNGNVVDSNHSPQHLNHNDQIDDDRNDILQQSKLSPPQQQQFTDDDILECGYFIPNNPSTAPIHHIVYTTIQNFLDQYVMKHNNNNNNNNGGSVRTTVSSEVVVPEDNSQLKPQQPSQPQHRISIIISLSGGVDSMVICAVLAHLQKYNNHYRDLQIIGIHIDYANRPESYSESKFVQYYCEHILCNVSYHCRRIDEVTRGITARDVYERMARDIRYQFYRDIIQLYHRSSTDVHSNDATDSISPFHSGKRTRRPNTAKDTIGVLLGHHRGDLRENVLSNAHKGCGPLDLSGMTAISHNDGVVLLRPLLPLEKSSMFDYAHKFGIPYFKDTTPNWSTRGKLRNKLLPLLEEIYGEGSMNNLSNLAVESDECRGLLHNVMIQPFLDSIIYQPMGISFATSQWIHQGVYFWKIVLREALHSAGFGMFSDKSVESFMKRVCCSNIHEGWLQCRKDYGVYLRTDGYIFVLYPASFPWGNPISVKNVVCTWTIKYTNVECTDENTVVNVGPWTVTTRRYKLNEQHASEKLEQKVFSTMEAFMEGEYEYWLEIPPTIGLVNNSNDSSDKLQSVDINQPRLVFTTFVKRTRPKAWKGIDPKMQHSLPLLGYAATAEHENETDSNINEKYRLRNGVNLSERTYTRIKLSLTTREF